MIPRILHRIWLGSPLPLEFIEYGLTWKKHHPEWEHLLWTEENLPPLVNQRLFDEAEEIAPRNVGQFRSDLARYEILARFGGVYVDTDFECRKPIDPLIEDADAFVVEVSTRWVNNALIGAVPGHPLMHALIEGLPHNVRRRRGARPNKLSGPQYLTPVWRRHAEGVRVLPAELFYPYLWDELHRAGEEFPEAYAIHRWANAQREGLAQRV